MGRNNSRKGTQSPGSPGPSAHSLTAHPEPRPLLSRCGPGGSKTRNGVYEQLLISGVSEKGLQSPHIDLQENRMNLT